MIRVNSSAFVKSMKKARSRLAQRIYNVVVRTAKMASTYAKATNLFEDRTGKLRASIRPTQTSVFGARVTADAKHARWIHDGTRAHTIRARRSKALRFVQDGQVRFARSVYHPGTAPRPFLSEAGELVETMFDRLCTDAVNGMFS